MNNKASTEDEVGRCYKMPTNARFCADEDLLGRLMFAYHKASADARASRQLANANPTETNLRDVVWHEAAAFTLYELIRSCQQTESFKPGRNRNDQAPELKPSRIFRRG